MMAHGRSIATCALATLFLAWRLPGHTQAIKNRSWRFPLRMLRFGKLSSLTKCFKLYRTREPASSLRICFFVVAFVLGVTGSPRLDAGQMLQLGADIVRHGTKAGRCRVWPVTVPRSKVMLQLVRHVSPVFPLPRHMRLWTESR